MASVPRESRHLLRLVQALSASGYRRLRKGRLLDDNAQIAIALLRACNISTISKAVYLTRAKRIVDFLFTGWDSANGGGMRWHVEKTVRNAISTSLAAVAVLELVKTNRQIAATASGGGVAVGVADKTEAELIAFARQCVQWVLDELQLDSGLIMDGVGGGPTYTLVLHISLSYRNEFRADREWAGTTPVCRSMRYVFCKS